MRLLFILPLLALLCSCAGVKQQPHGSEWSAIGASAGALTILFRLDLATLCLFADIEGKSQALSKECENPISLSK